MFSLRNCQVTSKKLGVIFVSLGFLFLLNAIFGRYIVLPGYLASLEQGQSTIASASQAIPVWKIIRYLLWAYSFKLGIYFIVLGATLYTRMSLTRRWSIAIGGFVYIAFAYIPLPSPDFHHLWPCRWAYDLIDDFYIFSLGK